MLKQIHIRSLCLCMMLILAIAASAQRPQITERLNQKGQVTIDAPQELVKRNNADLGKQQNNNAKDKKNKDKKKDSKGEEEKLNELDEDTAKDVKKDDDTATRSVPATHNKRQRISPLPFTTYYLCVSELL